MNHIEAMKQALEALEYADEMIDTACVPKAITNLRIAIEQAEKIEPVMGTKTWYEDGKVITQNLYPSDVYKQEKQEPDYQVCATCGGMATDPIVPFEQRAQREWVGLTQQDIDIAFDDTQEGGGFNEFAEAIEQILRRKNT